MPEATIRRRYERGLRNLFDLYLPLADSWGLYDGSSTRGPRLIAHAVRDRTQDIVDERTWQAVRRSAGVE